MIELFLKGFVIALAIAAPIGPMSILCMQRALHEGFRVGLMTGIGIALADGTYGLIIGLGLTSLSSLLIHHAILIRVLGGLFLMYLGIKIMATTPKSNTALKSSERSSWHACSTAYLLTLTNPSTIILFTAVFAGFGIGTFHPSLIHALSLVIGIIVGSSSWWLIYCAILVFIIHKRLNPKIMKIINIVSGGIILTFGVLTFY